MPRDTTRPRPPRAKSPTQDAPDATLSSKGNERKRQEQDDFDADFDSKGNEAVFGQHCLDYVRWALGLSDDEPTAKPSQRVIDDHDGDRGKTPNQRGLARIWDAWANPNDVGAIARLLDFFTKQFTQEGLQYAEGNSSSHGHLWLDIGTFARAFALHYKNERVLDVTGEWWRCWAALDDALLDSDGHRTAPNGRSAGATYDLGTVVAHMIRGTEPPHYSLLPNARGGVRPLIGPKFWTDDYNISAWTLRELLQRGDTLGGATEGKRSAVKLRDPLHIYRRGDEYVKVVPFARSSEFLFWCAKLNQPPDVPCIDKGGGRYEAPHKGGRFPQGLSNPFSAPVLEGSTLTVIEGVP